MQAATCQPNFTLTAQAQLSRPDMDAVLSEASGLIRHWAKQSVRIGESVDELHCDGMEAAADCFRSYNFGSGVPIHKYLKICVSRRWNRQRRDRKRAVRFVSGVDLDGIMSTKSEVEGTDTRMQVEEILGKISKPRADLLKMVYGIGVERKSINQISREVGTTSGTQSRMVQLAIEEFRSAWDQ